ncbi:glycosyltransferase family A protein [Aurantiacibacter suaedae]|uniref:glycosyltransferase family A protein n=1 Tax=Aurantiacibacter suaedae TaxID=2545755 RepID=UPI001386F196|nr:glycosyltransferase family A protein [Aurantiacibacter suaedae]
MVTVTSYPPRFAALGNTLRSLLDQEVRADRVELWIAEHDLDQLSRDIRDLEGYGLAIRPCRDLRSYKKLIPALEQEPGNFYVTADDDVYYPPEWLGHLVAAAQRHPDEVIAARAHLAFMRKDRKLAPYAEWELATARESVGEELGFLFPTGVGGVLYPPGCFDPKVFDEATFMELCPRGDDIWFFWMARRAGTRHRRIPEWFDVVEWPQTQEVALYNDNLLSDGNDRQIAAMERRFGPVPDLDGKRRTFAK